MRLAELGPPTLTRASQALKAARGRAGRLHRAPGSHTPVLPGGGPQARAPGRNGIIPRHAGDQAPPGSTDGMCGV